MPKDPMWCPMLASFHHGQQDGLANGAAGEADAEEEEEQRARTLREMKACAERLSKPRTAATARVLDAIPRR